MTVISNAARAVSKAKGAAPTALRLTIRTLRGALLPALVLVLTACAGHRIGPVPDDPHYAPVIAATEMPEAIPNGAIYRRGMAIDLYQNRAHRVGDVLTVNLNERTSASKSSGTSMSRDNQISLNEALVLGNNLMGDDLDLSTRVDSNVDFEGGANSDQSNQLMGNITVTVARVLPNGLLEVRGEKWLQLNHGSEFIRISGLVRKEDIGPDNTVNSTRIADVRIAYSGTGSLADANEPGWLTRFFVSDLWPL